MASLVRATCCMAYGGTNPERTALAFVKLIFNSEIYK
jgi:hypothetical protein